MWKLVLHIHQDMQLIAYLLCGILFALGDASPSSMRISPTSRPRAVSEPPIVHGCNVACLRCLAGRRSGHACRIPLQRAPAGDRAAATNAPPPAWPPHPDALRLPLRASSALLGAGPARAVQECRRRTKCSARGAG
jgi:hypothetical protein